ncbi:acid-sensing ion channel 4-A-like [Centruroides vittatus]|uniref:acid-sensing ion channel 4-A-like n=1 Tax=Centruroides vittatus TaxID=120091 RepID=UPI00350F71CB
MRKLNLEAQSQNSSLCGLCRSFAYRSSAHGVQRIASSQDNARRLMWSVVFLFAIAGCGFHSVYLILTYLSYPRMTITEEIHADHIDFPALTVCNLNPLKKSSIREHLLETHQSVSEFYNQDKYDDDDDEIEERGICFRSENEFLNKSKTMDLSDVWMSVIATKDSLMKCGHQAQDLITQCTYNARNCFNDSSTIVLLDQYPSPRYGLCHTIVVDKEPLRKVKKTGLSLGLRLTLNIEREDYLDLVSPEFGARLLVHPKGTYPTLQGGGVVLQPGTKTYVGVRMRKIERLPAPYRGCYDNFQSSQLIHLLRKQDQSQAPFAVIHNVYTYEYCQTLCRDIHLLKNCGCVEEVTPVNNKFCDPCNTTHARCRTRFYRNFTRANVDHDCQKFCLPACTDVRYDLTVSRSEWPNVRHQKLRIEKMAKFKTEFNSFSYEYA